MNGTVLNGRRGDPDVTSEKSPDMAAGAGRGTLSDLLREGISILSMAGIDHAEDEALWILEYALDISRLALHVNERNTVKTQERIRAMSLLNRRAAREPLQYILGTQEFCGLECEVGPEVLIPRPETELLVKTVSHHCVARSWPLIADIGTGSGCIAVALVTMLPAARVYAVDVSAAALGVARRNAIRHAVDDRVTCLQGDLFEPLRRRDLRGKLAAIVSNPPYIADGDFAQLAPEVGVYEPRLALAGGSDGLVIHRRLIHDAVEFLEFGGLLAVEVGQGQADHVRRIAQVLGGYVDIRTIPDAAGIDRIVCLTKA